MVLDSQMDSMTDAERFFELIILRNFNAPDSWDIYNEWKNKYFKLYQTCIETYWKV